MILSIETKVWESDWEKGIRGGGVARLFEMIPTPAMRRLLINNVAAPNLVVEEAQKLVYAGIIDEVILVKEHLSMALEHFRLSEEVLGRGLPYSSAELVGLLNCDTPYLCHFAGDCRMGHVSDWMEHGIELLEAKPDISVVNPIWNGNYGEVTVESQECDGQYAIGSGFSDQCYLVRKQEFFDANLTRLHPISERYPEYGGDLFEKRVDSWMRFEKKLRATDLRATYLHLG